jgi:hypothetical protein
MPTVKVRMGEEQSLSRGFFGGGLGLFSRAPFERSIQNEGSG